MPNFHISSTALPAPGARHSGSWIYKFNDVTDSTKSWTNSKQETNNNVQPEKPYHLEGDFTITAFLSGATSIRLQLGQGSAPFDVTTKIVTTTGTFHLDYYYKWADKSSPPTYLEELHKLDRTSSSHYIPR